jgi:hypothetical protein
VKVITLRLRKLKNNIIMSADIDDNVDDSKHFWLTCAVGALFRGARGIHIKHVCLT